MTRTLPPPRLRTRRSTAIALALTSSILFACAPRQAPPPAAVTVHDRTRLDATDRQYDLESTSRVVANERRVAAPLEHVWALIPATFDSLGIPVGLHDPRTYTYGSRMLRVSRQFAGARLSTLLDCGQTVMGPNADRYEVTLSVTTTLAAAPDGETSVYTAVSGRGRDPGRGGDTVRCASTGRLERMIAERLGAKLQRDGR